MIPACGLAAAPALPLSRKRRGEFCLPFARPSATSRQWRSPSPSTTVSAMKRALLLVVALALVLGVSAVAMQDKTAFPLLDWPAKAAAGTPRVAILLEFGVKDNDA